MVRHESAKLLYGGSIHPAASKMKKTKTVLVTGGCGLAPLLKVYGKI